MANLFAGVFGIGVRHARVMAFTLNGEISIWEIFKDMSMQRVKVRGIHVFTSMR